MSPSQARTMSLIPTVPDRLSGDIMFRLYKSLPPPHDDHPDTLATRDLVAMVSVANLGPMTTIETDLAANAVAAQAHSMDALACAAEHHDNLTVVMQCRAQAASMLRQAVRAMRQLRELREARETLRAQRRADEEAEARRAAAQAEALRSAAEALTRQAEAVRDMRQAGTDCDPAVPAAIVAPPPVDATADRTEAGGGTHADQATASGPTAETAASLVTPQPAGPARAATVRQPPDGAGAARGDAGMAARPPATRDEARPVEPPAVPWPWSGPAGRDESHDREHNPMVEISETRTGLVPPLPAPSPAETILIAALLSGGADHAARRADLTG